MKKIALPISNGKLSEHFGHCQNFAFFNIENQSIVQKELKPAPPHQPGLLPIWLVKHNVTDLIVGGIGHKAIQIFNQHKINVFVGVQSKEPAVLVREYLDGVLETNGNLCNH
jgi:predicted Fe-Mo cluster-binding NifX family protein